MPRAGAGAGAGAGGGAPGGAGGAGGAPGLRARVRGAAGRAAGRWRARARRWLEYQWGPEELAVAAGAFGALGGAAGAGVMVEQSPTSGFFKALLVVLTAAIGCIVASSCTRGLMIAFTRPTPRGGVPGARPVFGTRDRGRGLSAAAVRGLGGLERYRPEELPSSPGPSSVGGGGAAGGGAPAAGEAPATECSICLESFRAEEQVRRLICGHVFHKRCVD